VVPEARLERTEAGLVPAGEGWLVVNARDARWIDRHDRGKSLPLTGWGDEERFFPQLGVNLLVLEPGQPNSMYHWETDQEDFLVLSGEALLIIEGEERPVRAWDFVHCPPETGHTFVGAGDGPCIILAVGSRQHQGSEFSGAYTVEEAALRHGAGVEDETREPGVAYARFPESKPTQYRDGWLPGL
jgi:uncharacterized cupin superfamily protein